MLVTFKDTMGSDETMEAIDKMNGMVKDHCFVAGMGAVNTDTKNLTLQSRHLYMYL